MRSSRGMGAVRTSKMPKGSTITRKDNPDKVRMFAKGGKVKKAEGGPVQSFFKKRGIGTYTDSKGRVTTNNDLPSDVRDEVRSMGRVRNLYKEALALTSPKYAPDDYRSSTELLKEKQDEINRMYNPKTRGETLKKRLEDRVTPSKQAGGLMKKAKGGKVKKAEGGDVDFENTPASISSDITAPSYSFGEEFTAARKAGMKTFEYKGKKYTTEMAKPSAAKPAAVSTPAAKSKVVAGTPTVTASTPASKPVSNPTRAAVAYPRVNIMLTDKPAAAAKPAASKAAPRPTDKYTTRAELEMGRPYSNPPPFVGGIRKDTERFVEASRRSKPAAASKAPSSEVKGRAPTVGAEAKAKRARLDNQGRGMAKGGNANFIKGAIKKPGALRASLGAKPGKPIPAGKLDKASKAPGKLGQRARFAEMLRGFRKNKKQDG